MSNHTAHTVPTRDGYTLIFWCPNFAIAIDPQGIERTYTVAEWQKLAAK